MGRTKNSILKEGEPPLPKKVPRENEGEESREEEQGNRNGEEERKKRGRDKRRKEKRKKKKKEERDRNKRKEKQEGREGPRSDHGGRERTRIPPLRVTSKRPSRHKIRMTCERACCRRGGGAEGNESWHWTSTSA